MQEVFLRLCKESPEQVADHIAEWLFTVCRNRALDIRERDKRRRKLDENSLGAPRLLFRIPAPLAAEYDVTGDGQQFILFGSGGAQ